MKKISFMIPLYLLIIGIMIGLAKGGSDAITAFSENSVIKNRNVVVIDAGHGGIDGGATSVSGITESKLNLEISLKLQDMFHLLGIKTIMIRTEDVSVYTSGETISAKKISDLKERVRIVNEQSNCILLSIHQNYYVDSRYYGAQVFYGPKGDGKTLAPKLQKTLKNVLNPDSSRNSKPAQGVYLMQHIDCTGLLIECGFLSNPKEDLKLQEKGYQQKLCSVIATVISNYLNT